MTKRAYHEALSPDDGLQQCGHQQAMAGKKHCMPSSFAGQLGVVPGGADAAEVFLQRLARSLGGSLADGSPVHGSPTGSALLAALPALDNPVWRCFAELNILLEQHWQSMPSAILRGYHSFTRNPKATLWARFAHALGGYHVSDLRETRPLHMQMVGFVLDSVFRSYAEAGIVVYTFRLPDFLLPWAHRWGYQAAELTVFAVSAYAPDGSMSPDMPSDAPPVRRLFVPRFTQ